MLLKGTSYYPGFKYDLGFTLMEVLVALVITGMAVTVFFQVMSAGIRLEFSSAGRTSVVLEAGQIMGRLMALDVRDDDFHWQGEENGSVWSLEIQEVETLKNRQSWDDFLKLNSELYRYVFIYKNGNNQELTMVRYVQYYSDFFSEDFKRRHFN